MTKFIFHGGATRKPTEGNRKFFAEMAKGLSEPVRILLVYFAREEKEWAELSENDKQNFHNASPTIKMEFSLANSDNFIDQVKNADVIYVRGGVTPRLQEVLKKFPNLLELLDEKVYGGSSAGMNVLARYFYSFNFNEIREGLGLLPIKTFPHYDDTKHGKLQQLKDYKEDLPTYTIKEGEYFIY